jgi:hypothetical protein
MEANMTVQFQSQEQPTIAQLLPMFTELLPVQVVRNLIRDSKKKFYERLFTPLVVVWGLAFQRLNSDHTCDAALSHIAGGAVDHLDEKHDTPLSERIESESTSAYCKGRQRLPLSVLKGALTHTACVTRQWLGEDGLWLGHSVGLLDGTTILLRPEQELVDHYGRHENQYGETYWVVMRLVVAFDLHSGAVLGMAEGSLHKSEQELTVSVLAQALPNCVYTGDRNFGVFSVAQAARHYEADVNVRMTSCRAKALAGRKIKSGEDMIVTWTPSKHDQLHEGMSSDPITGRLIYVRIQRNGFRPIDLYLFTSLLDAEVYTLEELVKLFDFHWHVELNLRYVKSTLDMDLLTAKSVDMVLKELWAGLLAYNIVRGYMTRAAMQANLSPLTLSFTRCWRRVRDTLLAHRPGVTQTVHRLLTRLAKFTLPKRPRFRIEPRAVRRRPATYPNLKGSRSEARQHLIEQMKAS